MSRIEVFFTSGHRIKLADGAVFISGAVNPQIGDTVAETGVPVINWDAVAWVRRVVETDDD